MLDLEKYSASQREAICHGSGPALVLAGPGSGKTSVLTKRLQYLIQELLIPPEKILVVTFTKAAAREMQERFERLMQGASAVCFGTFHSVFYRILQEHHKNSPFTILNEQEKTFFLRQVLRQQRINEDYLEILQECFGKIKNKQPLQEMELPQELSKEQLAALFEAYRERCREKNKLDFDDMAYECLRLFQSRPDILKKWQARFSYLLVDEYQDIAPIQAELLTLLALPEKNVFAVGDDDQTIYGFRGADTKCMLDFPKKYQGARTIFLETNYRSRPDIVEAATRVISQNKDRFFKRQTAARESGGYEAVSCQGFSLRKEEYEELISVLQEYEKNGKLNECAVLYRKNKDAGRLIRMLEKKRIPYHCTEKKQNLKTHFITQDITAYLRLIEGDRRRKTLFQIMNRPERGLGRDCCREETFSFLELKQVPKLEADCKRAKNMSLYAKLMYIRKGFGYENWLLQEKAKETEGCTSLEKEEYREILHELMEKAKQLSGIREWEAWLLEKEDTERQNADRRNAGGKKPGVSILTYHACKGLEFECVILPDLIEGIVPHKKASGVAELEEERRMFYVAMTRAKERLYLYYLTGTKEEPETMSRFLPYSSSASTSSSNSALSRYSSNASATISYSSSSSM